MTPVQEHYDEVRRAVEVSAASFAKRIWWTDREDLQQQGWLYATEIMNRQRTFDPSVGVPLFAYLKRAVSRLLYNYVCGLSAPVSAPRRNAGVPKGLQRAPADDIPEDIGDLERDIIDLFSDGTRRRRLETMLVAGVGEEVAELAVPYLIGEERDYKGASARAGRPVPEVKAAVRQVRKFIANSPEMWRLWA